MKVLVTGGTGFLGSKLVEELMSRDYDIVLVTRQNPSLLAPFPGHILPWPLTSDHEPYLADIDAVIHLAGAPIADGRWTKERKARIYNSRIQGTRDIVDMMRLMPKLKTFISASAVGYYGSNDKEDLDESSLGGYGFLADVCRDWESEALRAQRPGLRTVILRTGPVLGRGGGVIEKLEGLFQNHMGGPAGDGTQQVSWIHWSDWLRAVMFLLEESDLEGPVNLTAPQPVSNRAMALEMARLFGQKKMFTAPAFALQLAFGEMATMVLEGQRVLPSKLLAAGFKFEFPELGPALENIFDIDEVHRRPDSYYYTSQWIPRPPKEFFEYLSDRSVLEVFMPEYLNFKFAGQSTAKIGLGTLVNYQLKLHGITVDWQVEVSKWEPNRMFVERTIKGPYPRWDYYNILVPACGGTLYRVKCLYRLPLGAIGRIGAQLIVQKDAEDVFNYQKSVVQKLFAE